MGTNTEWTSYDMNRAKGAAKDHAPANGNQGLCPPPLHISVRASFRVPQTVSASYTTK